MSGSGTVSLGVALAIAASSLPWDGRADGPSGRRMASFSLPTPTGQFDLTEHLGRDVILVAFWATWCKPCKEELAALAPVWERLKHPGRGCA